MSVSRLAVFCRLASALALARCDRKGGDTSKQVGANPVLPEINQYLLPPMRIAPVVQWGSATPTVAPGLKVEALATGFVHPSKRHSYGSQVWQHARRRTRLPA
jgi:hypothetical protein